MMHRLLWMEMRSSRLGLVTVAVALLTLLVAGSQRTGGVVLWVDVEYGMFYSLILTAPVAAAAGSWLGGRDLAFGLGELTSSGVRPWARHLVTLAAGLGSVLAGAAVGAIVTVGATLGGATFGRLSPWPFVVVASVLTACVATGYVTGRAGWRWVNAPLAGIAVYFGSYALLVWGGALDLLGPLPPVQFSVFTQPTSGLRVAQTAWFLGLAAAALTIPVAANTRRPSTVLGALAGVAIAAVGASVATGTGQWEAEREGQPTPVCDERGVPRVCVHPAYARSLEEVASQVRGTMAPLAAIGAAPAEVVQDRFSGVTLRADGGIGFGIPVVGGELSPSAIGGSVLRPLIVEGCPGAEDEHPGREAQLAVLAGVAPDQARYLRRPETMLGAERFAAIPEADQLAWLGQHLEGLRRCELRVVDLPAPS